MGFGSTCLTVLSGIFQTTCLIVGLALVAYGTLSAYSILLTNSDTVIKAYGTVIPSIVITAFGLILGIIVLLGCCGICRGSPLCVEWYSAFLLMLAFTQIAFGGYCVVSYGNPRYYTNLTIQINSDINRAVQAYNLDPVWMDEMQRWVKCCGYIDPLKEYKFYTDLLNANELPLTCCDKSIITCTKDDYYQDACSKTVAEFTIVTNFIMGWISIAVGVTEFIASLLGICLSCCIWRNQMGSWR